MKEKWNAERGGEGGKKALLSVKLSRKEGENCAIFICPYRETTVATIPAIGLIQEDKLN